MALTANELAILLALAQQPGRIMSRDQLLRALHGSAEAAFDRSVDVIVSRIRSKIEREPKQPETLVTVRRAGYVLIPPDES